MSIMSDPSYSNVTHAMIWCICCSQSQEEEAQTFPSNALCSNDWVGESYMDSQWKKTSIRFQLWSWDEINSTRYISDWIIKMQKMENVSSKLKKFFTWNEISGMGTGATLQFSILCSISSEHCYWAFICHTLYPRMVLMNDNMYNRTKILLLYTKQNSLNKNIKSQFCDHWSF